MDNKKFINSKISELAKDIPPLKNFFEEESIIRLLELVSILIKTGDSTIDRQILIRYLGGLALIPLYQSTKNKKILFLINKRVSPIHNHLINCFISDEYQKNLISKVITGTTTYKPNEETTCLLSLDELMLHFKRTENLPLIPEDVIRGIPELKTYWREIHNVDNDSTQMKGLVCLPKYKDKLSSIAVRLINNKLIRKQEKAVFISLFNEPSGLVFWDISIHGSKAALFDLIERITGKVTSPSELKLLFYTDKYKIHMNWRDKDGANTKLIDKVMKDI